MRNSSREDEERRRSQLEHPTLTQRVHTQKERQPVQREALQTHTPNTRVQPIAAAAACHTQERTTVLAIEATASRKRVKTIETEEG